MRQSLARTRARVAALVCTSLVSLTALLLIGSPVHASGTSTILGTVRDSAGNPLKDVRVTLTGEGLPAVKAVTSDQGVYRFATLWPFTIYAISAESPLHRVTEYDGMQLASGETRHIDFRLKQFDEREVVVLTSRDPFPHQEMVAAFVAHLDVPVRVVDLDAERDPAETVRRIRAEKPNAILGAGNSAAHLVRREVPDIPAILTLVDEPGQQQLKSVNLCFISHHPEARDILDGVLAVLPDAKRIGMIYHADGSWRFARDLRAEAQARGLEVALGPCYNPGHLKARLKELPPDLDVLVVPLDQLTVIPAAAKRISNWALTNRVPLAGPNPGWVGVGALFSYGAPLDEVGLEAARIAARILHEQRQPFEFNREIIRLPFYHLTVNEETAVGLGVEIPPALLSQGD
ncbi:MAG TPA: ABC transporter substrate binding protein [Candidatus Polarisedimenticolia bacterium]|nr:ABC transporter substrate binding protein [Candidatus Polarisedimenticolia bacterium]